MAPDARDYNLRSYEEETGADDIWQEVSLRTLAQALPRLQLPIRSPAMQALFLRAFLNRGSPPAGGETGGGFEILRLEALYRTGAIDALIDHVTRSGGLADQPVAQAYYAQALLAAGDLRKACETANRIGVDDTALPRLLQSEVLLLTSYCAAKSRNIESAALIANLARDQGISAPIPYAVMDHLSGGALEKFDLPGELGVRDYAFMRLNGEPPQGSRIVGIASPQLLYALSTDRQLALPVRLAAAEQAARVNIEGWRVVDAAYRAAGGSRPSGRLSGSLERATLFNAVLDERNVDRKAQLIRQLHEKARQAGLHYALARLLKAPLVSIRPSPRLAWFAKPAIEILLLAGDYGRAMGWANFAHSGQVRGGLGGGSVRQLYPLLDIAVGPQRARRGAGLTAATDMARNGRLSALQLQRLVTVLDALQYNVPIPLWEAASRTAQPVKGHLPPTGALNELAMIGEKRLKGRAILSVLQALGAGGPEKAHMLTLGEVIKTLSAVGLEEDARRIGLEALLAIWG